MKKKGFTLIELIVVIAIIGVLAAILVPAMLGYVRKSKITTANTTAKSIYNAIKYGVLKEFYSTVIQPDFFKLSSERFVGELFKLKQRLFQLKKKSVVSNLT